MFGIREVSEAKIFTIFVYAGPPLFTSFEPMNTFVARPVVGVSRAVAAILRDRTQPEVRFSVVEAVTIDMIDLMSWLSVHNYAVHSSRYSILAFVASRRIKSLPFVAGVPSVLIKLFEIFIIDYGNFSLG